MRLPPTCRRREGSYSRRGRKPGTRFLNTSPFSPPVVLQVSQSLISTTPAHCASHYPAYMYVLIVLPATRVSSFISWQAQRTLMRFGLCAPSLSLVSWTRPVQSIRPVQRHNQVLGVIREGTFAVSPCFVSLHCNKVRLSLPFCGCFTASSCAQDDRDIPEDK